MALAAIVVLAVAASLLGTAAPALADTGNIVEKQNTPPETTDGWQAGTCKSETPECNIEHPEQFFEQAGGHPQVGFTQITVKHKAGTLGSEEPVGELKTVRVDLPVGLSVNPQATDQCPLTTFVNSGASACPPTSAVGKSIVTASALGQPVPPTPVLEPAVYNLVPKEHQPALFGFELAGNDIYLEADVAWSNDYHEGFTIPIPETALSKLISEGLIPVNGAILKNRLVFNGRAGNGTFVTTPIICLGESLPTSPFQHAYSTWLRADSYSEPDPSFPAGSSYFESRIPNKEDFGAASGTFPKECDTIPFAPSLEVEPGTTETDSPAGAAVTVEVPFEKPSPTEIASPGPTKQASSQLKDATVTMPLGMGLDPSAANGLEACSDAQFGKGTRHPVECPAASKIGTVKVQTPPLPPNSLEGNVYLGQQLSRDPTSGEEYRIFVDVESARYGISARLVGHVAADPKTGRLTATFADNPQVPFESFRLQFDGGQRAPLTSPPVCGPHETTSTMTPWSSTPGSIPAGEPGGPSNAEPAHPSKGFTLASAPGGGACPKALGERSFKPGFGAQAANPQAGAFSALRLTMTRAGGEQELKGATVGLPPGLTAKLAGVSYCPEAAIAAAEANSGAAEAAHSSCPASSLIGTATVLTGSGEPLRVDGKAFLAGPYHGAPLSLAIVTPATAGPFDLGSVVVRVALFVEPETAQVRAVSDPIPHVFGGTLLDVSSITVEMNRPDFSLNPTSCAPKQIAATIRGGGSNPSDPAAFSSASVSAPFQVSGCEKLGFAPTLSLRLSGGMRRAGHPALRAVFAARPGDANPARVAVTLPHFLFLDQANIAKVCTRVQFAEGSAPGEKCPADSVYGWARAFTPLLDRPLEGPVFLRSSSNVLPDLVASLRGQVNVVLDGRTDSVNGRIRNSFETVPDVPVSRFLLMMPGGRHGLLVNSQRICPRRGRGPSLATRANMTGQNGKTVNRHFKLGVPCRRRHHQHRHHKHHHHHHH